MNLLDAYEKAVEVFGTVELVLVSSEYDPSTLSARPQHESFRAIESPVRVRGNRQSGIVFTARMEDMPREPVHGDRVRRGETVFDVIDVLIDSKRTVVQMSVARG